MSAVARNYAYRVKVDPKKPKEEPTISLETLKQYQADIAKYVKESK